MTEGRDGPFSFHMSENHTSCNVGLGENSASLSDVFGRASAHLNVFTSLVCLPGSPVSLSSDKQTWVKVHVARKQESKGSQVQLDLRLLLYKGAHKNVKRRVTS